MIALIYNITYISVLSALLPILTYIVIRNFKLRFTGILFFLACLSLFSDSGSLFLLYQWKINPNIISNIFIALQFIILSWMYFSLQKKLTSITYKHYSLVIIIFIIAFIMDSFLYEKLHQNQSISRTLTSIIMLAYSIQLYALMLKKHVDILSYAPFWINTAVFFYFGFNIIIFITTHYFFSNYPDIGSGMWAFHNLANITKNILFAIGIYRTKV